MRTALHYLAAAVITPIYGVQVCPYIEGLAPGQVIVPVLAALGLQFGLRGGFRARIVDTAPLDLRVQRAFWLELSLFIASALGLMIYHTVTHDFPLVSGLKVLLGLGGLGFFAAVDIALSEEMRVADLVEQGHGPIDPARHPYSMTRRIASFAVVSVVVLIGVFILLVLKDMDWLVEVGDSVPIEAATLSILKEFLFVLAIVLPHTINIIRSYARNLKRLIDNQTLTMSRVALGDLSARVPVASNDELGLIADHTNRMTQSIAHHAHELARTRDVTILSLATLAETRDNETGAHILRTQHYVRILADHLKDHPDFAPHLDPESITLMFKSAPLHDIGKVGIPDAILLKPGRLEDDEFEIMKTHPRLGADALAVAERELGSTSFLRHAKDIALTHHEKWDGSGYPQGLAGHAIPVSGRLMALADVYDALISKRVYKPAFPHDKAAGIIKDASGTHFDPTIVQAFIACENQFRAVAKQYADIHTEAAE